MISNDYCVLHMLDKAAAAGLIKDNTVLIEATLGNTGASLAMLGALRGHKVILTTTNKTSPEKIAIMRALGADVRVCPQHVPEGHDNHYITLAQNLAANIKNAYFMNQYNDCSNIDAHYASTGPEIWQQLNGQIDYLVCCASSGGTISGIGRYLKEKNPTVKVILADPMGSALGDFFLHQQVSRENIRSYQVEGAGKDVICDCNDFTIIDEVIKFTDDDAFNQARIMAENAGILVGGSSGGAVFAALTLLKHLKQQANVVVVLPDSGMKYLSTIYSNVGISHT